MSLRDSEIYRSIHVILESPTGPAECFPADEPLGCAKVRRLQRRGYRRGSFVLMRGWKSAEGEVLGEIAFLPFSASAEAQADAQRLAENYVAKGGVEDGWSVRVGEPLSA
jgi:hypothetical protein